MKVAQGKKKTFAKGARNAKPDQGTKSSPAVKPSAAPNAAADIKDSDDLNFQKPRAKRRPDPKIAFFELFLNRMDRDGKTYQFSFRDQMSRGMKWGLYKIQVMKDKLDELQEKWNRHNEHDPDAGLRTKSSRKGGVADVSPADPEGFRNPQGHMQEANFESSHRYSGANGSAQSEGGSQQRSGRGNLKGISSEQVGPERQVVISDEPMPLAKPKVKSAPKRITVQKIDGKAASGQASGEASNDNEFHKRVNKKASDIKTAKDKKSSKSRKDLDEPQM